MDVSGLVVRNSPALHVEQELLAVVADITIIEVKAVVSPAEKIFVVMTTADTRNVEPFRLGPGIPMKCRE